MRRVCFGMICAVVGWPLLVAAFAEPVGAAELKTWRHGIINAQSDAGIIMMVTRGFAKKQGLDLKIVQFKGGAVAMRALLAGELDSFESDPSVTIVSASRGADVKIIGCFWPGLPHGILVRRNIESTKDLMGKTIAISGPGGLADLLARALLESEGIPATKVKFANLGGGTDRFKALIAGVVDAAVLSDEYVPIGAQQGIKLLVSGRKILPDYMRLCIMSTGQVLSAKRDEAARFLAAEMAALRYALSHRDVTLKLTREITGEKADDPRPGYVFDQAVHTNAVDPMMSIPLDKLTFMQNLLVKTGTIQKPADVSKIVDPSIRAEALTLMDR